MGSTAYSKTPLKQIGHVIAWHDERGDRSSGIERFNRGDYAE